MIHNTIYFLVALVLLTLATACEREPEVSDNLVDLKNQLKEKKSNLSALQEEIDSLQAAIVRLSPALKEKAKYVDTTHIKANTFERYVEIQGMVTADDRAHAVSEIAGRVTQLQVEEGDYVRKGQLIAVLDVSTVEKQIEEINTQLSLAEDIYERQKRLWDQKIGSEIQYLQAKNNVDRLIQSRETIAHQLTKSKVYAPITGVVDNEGIKQGEVVSPGMPIVTILNTSKVKVSTDLPERYLQIINRGQDVQLYFPSLDQEMKGRVTMLGRTIDPANRTLELEITPRQYSALLKPNLLAEIKILEMAKEDVISIPTAYMLQQVDGQQFVYKVVNGEDGPRAHKQYVETGESSGDKIEILSGLTTQDVLVSGGARNISDGELLKF